jgi:hypothetical protein
VYYLLLFSGNHGYANVPQCYVRRRLPVLFILETPLYQIKRYVLLAYFKVVALRWIPPKHAYLPTKLHGVGSQKAVILTVNAVQDSNLTAVNFLETLFLLIIWITTAVFIGRDERSASRSSYTLPGEITLQPAGQEAKWSKKPMYSCALLRRVKLCPAGS